jgi:RNA polymerase sigma-70 factor (ECF subfamily)
MENCLDQFGYLSWHIQKDSVPVVSVQFPLLTRSSFSLKTQETKIPVNRSCDIQDIRDSQSGDPDAFRRLVKRYQSHVSKLLWKFSRNRDIHEELVQESFVQAYLSLQTYKAYAPFEHWLSRIVIRVGYRHWKQSKQHAYVSIENCDWTKFHTPVNSNEAAELVHWLLSQLPPRDRLVLTLRYLEQCNVEETARHTGWSQSLVKVQTHRAIQKLKKLLKTTNIEFEL